MQEVSNDESAQQQKEVPAKKEKYRQMMCSPMDGYGWNPLNSYPVNMMCFCGSGKKFKKCCQSKIPKCLPNSLVRQMTAEIDPFTRARIMVKFFADREQIESKEAPYDAPESPEQGV